jgi:hypothetical protein
MTEQEMRDVLDRRMNPTLVAYRKQVENVRRKIRLGEPLEEGERCFACWALESAESVFNNAHFLLSQYVEPTTT